MKPASLLFACLLLFQRAGAEQIELIVGNEVSAAAYAQLRQLTVMGTNGEILNRRPEPSIFIDRTEYVAQKNEFVVAIEVTRDPRHKGGKPLLTRVYINNEGQRVSANKDGEWKWVDAKRVVIDTKTWKASIQCGEQTAPSGGEKPSN